MTQDDTTSEIIRTGIGYDVHAMVPDRPLILGGVSIPHDSGPRAHSDGDVLAHAVIDAILGAAALGDIGQLFPDTDMKWKGADSLSLLSNVCDRVHEQGLRVGNVDATVVLDQPKLRPFVERMRDGLAGSMQVETTQVSVKATTSEGIGFVGRGEGISAMATCILLPTS